MNILKIIGHLEFFESSQDASIELDFVNQQFSKSGFACSHYGAGLRIKIPHIILYIECSGDGAFLIEGEGVLTPQTNDDLRNALSKLNASFQLDFFEEDGRMIKRIQS